MFVLRTVHCVLLDWRRGHSEQHLARQVFEVGVHRERQAEGVCQEVLRRQLRGLAQQCASQLAELVSAFESMTTKTSMPACQALQTLQRLVHIPAGHMFRV